MSPFDAAFMRLAVQRGLAPVDLARRCAQEASARGGSPSQLLSQHARLSPQQIQELRAEVARLGPTAGAVSSPPPPSDITQPTLAPQVLITESTPSGSSPLTGFGTHPGGGQVSGGLASGGLASGGLASGGLASSGLASGGFGTHPGGGGFGLNASSPNAPLSSSHPSSHGSSHGSPGSSGHGGAAGGLASGGLQSGAFRLGPGQHLGRYRLVRELGRGGMGVVWRAVQVDLNREVALKVLLLRTTTSESLRRRFEHEAKTVARLAHPSIVGVHDVGQVEGALYFAMELVEGESLHDRIEREGALPVDESLRIALDIANGLECAHSAGIVHRDLKPANILLPARGCARITDFGVSKDAAIEAQTISGEVLGTPHFMSPEQADGDSKRVDARADLYSLGATLYSMLTGAPPFEGSSRFDVLAKVANDVPAPPSQRNPEVSPDLDAVVLKCLAKKREDRYGTADDLVRTLETILRRLQRRAARRGGRSGLAVGAIVVLASLCGALGTYGMYRLSAAPSDAPESEDTAAAAGPSEAEVREAQREAARALSLPPEELGEALEVAEAAVAQSGGDVTTRAALGVLLARDDRPQDALPHLEAARELEPLQVEALAALGVVYLELGYPSEDVDALIYRLQEAGEEGEGGAHWVQARRALQGDSTPVALWHLQQAAEQLPDHLPLRLELARQLLEARRFSDVERHADAALDLHDRSAEALGLRARARLELNRTRQARADAEQAQEYDLLQPDAQFVLEALEAQTPQPPPRQPVQRPPSDPGGQDPDTEARQLIGQLRTMLQGPRTRQLQQQVQPLFQRLFTLQGLSEPDVIHERIHMALMVQAFPFAARDAQHLLQLVTPNAEILEHLARALIGMNQHQQALPVLDQALRLEPNQPTCLSERAQILKALGRNQQALDDFQRLRQLVPNQPEPHHQTSHLLSELGRHDEALQAAEQACRLQPENGHLHAMRGELLVTLGRSDEAVEAYTRAQRAQLSNEEAQQVARALQALSSETRRE